MHRRHRPCAVATLLALSSVVLAQPSLRVTEIVGPVGCVNPIARGFTTDGKIYGNCTVANNSRAFVGTIAGGYSLIPVQSDSVGNVALNVDRNGGLVGYSIHTLPLAYWSPARWTLGGTQTDLGLPLGTYSNAKCVASNIQGRYLINAEPLGSTASRTFVSLFANTFVEIKPMLGFTECTGVDMSPNGSVIGNCDIVTNGSPGDFLATVWNLAGNPSPLPPLAGFAESRAIGIGDTGAVFGTSENPGKTPTVWTGSQPRALSLGGGTTGVPSSIDSLGNVYGSIDGKAVIWPSGGEPTDLNAILSFSTPGWVLTNALGIDGQGRILVSGVHDGTVRTGIGVYDYGSSVQVESVLVNFGYVIQGDQFSFNALDGDVLRVGRAFVPNITLPPVQVTVAGHTTYAQIRTLQIRLWSRVTVAGSFRQDIELFNFQTNTWDPVDIGHNQMSMAMHEAVLSATGTANRYRRSDGLLRARYSVRPSGFIASQAWAADHDQVEWTVAE